MANDDAELEIRLAAEDELSEVVAQAGQNYDDFMEELIRSSTDAKDSVALLGDATLAAGEKAEVAGRQMTETFTRVGTAARESSTQTRGFGVSISEVGRAFQKGMSGFSIGAQLASGGLRQTAGALTNFGARALQVTGLVSGLSLTLTAGAAVYGLFAEKAKKAEDAARRAAEESMRATEKLASEGTRLVDESSRDQEQVHRQLVEARARIDDESLGELQRKYREDVALSRVREEDKLKNLQERLDKERDLEARANAAKATAKGPAESKVAEEAAAAARKAQAQTQSAMAQERELAAVERSRTHHEFIRRSEEESLKLRQQSVQVLNRLHETRLRDQQTLNQTIQAKLRALNLDKDLQAHASELERIDELRRQGKIAEANLFKQILELTIAREAAEKNQTVLKARVEAAEKMNTEAEREQRLLLSTRGLLDDQRRIYERIFDVYSDLQDKINKGMDVTLADSLYQLKKKQILEEHERIQSRLATQYARQSQDLWDQYEALRQQKESTEAINAARLRGDATRAQAADDHARAQAAELENARLILEYQRRIADAVREGDLEHVKKLQQMLDTEQRILDLKRQETAEQKRQRELANAGIDVDSRGHADKGLASSWRERNRRHREEKLLRQQRSHGARFGGGGEEGFGYGSMELGAGQDFSGVVRQGRKRKDPHVDGFLPGDHPLYPELEGKDALKGPQVPEGPRLTQPTGEGASPVADLQAATAKLAEFAAKQAELSAAAKALGVNIEPLPGLEKLIAEDVQNAADKAVQIKTEMENVNKRTQDLAMKAGDIATATTAAAKQILDAYNQLEQKYQDLKKALDDLQKAGG